MDHVGSAARPTLALLAAAVLAVAPLLGAEPTDAEASYALQHQITAGVEFDYFGVNLDIAGDSMVVVAGRQVEDRSPMAYFYHHDDRGDTTPWHRVAVFPVPDFSSAAFGSLALDGDTAAIGAPLRGEEPLSEAGDVYLFERDPTDPTLWSQVGVITNPDPELDDRFGSTVALAGDTLAVGARGEDSQPAGTVYVFERDPEDPADWLQVAKLTSADGRLGDQFGTTDLAFADEATLLVGDEGAGPGQPGFVYVFRRDPVDGWGQVGELSAVDFENAFHFGRSLAVDGETLLVGSLHDWGQGLSAGAAHVLERDPDDPASWTEVALLTAPDGAPDDDFGVSVALSADLAVVGARWDDGAVEDTGSTWIYRRDPDDPIRWDPVAKLVGQDPEGSERFGRSVGVTGETVVAGAHQGADFHGAVYLFAEVAVDPRVTVDGACPGEVTIGLAGGTPRARLRLFGAPGGGSFPIPDGPCVGVELALDDPVPLLDLSADVHGEASVTRSLAVGHCGALVQLVDWTSCAVSEAVALP